jgi:hypothetical protein
LCGADVLWCAARVEHEEIDSVNILQATMLAMRRATGGLFEKYSNHHPSSKGKQQGGPAGGRKKADAASSSVVPPSVPVPVLDPSQCIALVDGNRAPEGMPVPRTEWVIKVVLCYCLLWWHLCLCF